MITMIWFRLLVVSDMMVALKRMEREQIVTNEGSREMEGENIV